MHGKRIAFVGESQCGKTTLAKEMLAKSKKTAHVVSIKTNFDIPIYVNFDQYLEDNYKKKNSLFIIDEARSFIRLDERWMERNRPKFFEMLRTAKEWNNIIVMIFHAFRDIPVWLPMHLDVIERWETQENKTQQAKRFESFPEINNTLLKRPHLPKYEHIYLKIES